MISVITQHTFTAPNSDVVVAWLHLNKRKYNDMEIFPPSFSSFPVFRASVHSSHKNIIPSCV